METQEGSGRGGEGEKEEESKFWSSLGPITYSTAKKITRPQPNKFEKIRLISKRYRCMFDIIHIHVHVLGHIYHIYTMYIT